SIEHLTTSDGYVVSATVAPMDGSGELFTVSGADLVPFIHTYGVTGVLVEVEVRTDPARDWTAVYAAFDSYAGLAAGLRAMGALDEGPVHLHLELFARGPGAMVVAEYRSEQEMLAGIGKMEAIGMGVHSPHQWYVDRNVALAIETARRTDPKGLLNPGKLTTSP